MSFRLPARIAVLVVLVSSPVAGAGAAAPPVIQLPAHTVALPSEGNAALVRLTLVVKPRPGKTLPAKAAVHVFIVNAGQLPGAVVITGAAQSRRSHGEIHYDSFLALLNRVGSPQGSTAPAFALGIQGVPRSAVRATSNTFRSYGNVLGRRLPGSFCQAAMGDVHHPTAVGFVDPQTSDGTLASSARLTLARSAAALCNGGADAVTRVNNVLQQLGGGLIGTSSTTFSPQTLAGTWKGTWNDTRFGTSGNVNLVVTPSTSSFTFNLNLGGNVFGCSPPPPTGGTVTAGSGPNHWNPSGFSLQITGPQGGSISLSYDAKTRALTGNGRPGCRPGVSWVLHGSFSGNVFNGSMTTTLEDGSTAPAVITLTRS